ncbi:MAG TPA: hypothetical protein VFD42_09100 [Chloroflexota bacterium]|nr:hypothetical protein [Chloroflexota bacterium]
MGRATVSARGFEARNVRASYGRGTSMAETHWLEIEGRHYEIRLHDG